jgi:hypothetical protein
MLVTDVFASYHIFQQMFWMFPFKILLVLYCLFIKAQSFVTPTTTLSASRPIKRSSMMRRNPSKVGTSSVPGGKTPATSQLPDTALNGMSIGFFGHSGLAVASIVLVRLFYAVLFPKSPDEAPTGIMNRCPWPFILSHDPKQFFKDSPTYMVLTYFILSRVVKTLARRPA